MALLEVRDLHIDFVSHQRSVRAVEGVSFALDAGEVLCLVGESGSGKSVTALSVVRLLPSPPASYPSGGITVSGRNVFEMDRSELRALRGGVVSYIFQEPGASLNPVFRVGNQILEMLQTHQPSVANTAEVIRLLKLVGISAPEVRVRSYPHELSGGMQQRIMIAMAIASRPKLLIADEPTTALDVTIQAQIIELLDSLRRELGMAILLITHNLGIVSRIADRVAVMYAGQIVEQGTVDEVLENPRHPYTRSLLDSVPRIGSGLERLTSIPGTVPTVGAWPAGCRFHPRCFQSRPDCAVQAPVISTDADLRQARCLYPLST